ncbi:MAG: hypothetical protein MUP40_01970, partial [Actinobacteria bacterium]|nr:hypothetical protein [Actinomycetota bacterium]
MKYRKSLVCIILSIAVCVPLSLIAVPSAQAAIGAISGTVTAQVGGAPVVDCHVRAYDPSGTLVQVCPTDASGYYRVWYDGMSGNYKIKFDAESDSGY